MSAAPAIANETPLDRVLRALADQGIKSAGSEKWKARCPAHEDQTASLSIGIGEGGRALLNCFANCNTEDIVAAVGMEMKDLMPTEEKQRPKIVATYPYVDARGGLLFQSVRLSPKTFRQRRPDGRGGWLWNLDGVERVLYKLPELLAADPAKPVLVVEGEKDTEALIAIGFVATTNAGGAGKWRSEYGEALRGRRVVILPDHDEAGAKHGEQVARALTGVAAGVKVVELPGLPPKGDVSDWIAAGGTAEKLLELIGQAGTTEHVRGPDLVAIATIASAPIVFRWDGRLEAGEVATLEGMPSAGKSTLGSEIAAAISTGRALYGDRPRKPESIIWISHEESREKTLRPRLDAAGADVSRIFVCDGRLLPSFPENYPWLTQQIQKLDAGVVFIDPIDSYLDFGHKGDSNSNVDVRSRLMGLAVVAQETGATIVLVRHWRKSGNVHAIYRATGSVAYTSVARTVINVVLDPEDPDKRIVTWAKMNNAPVPSSLAFCIGEGRRVEWLGEDARSAQEIMDSSDDHDRGARAPTAVDRAVEWLRSELSAGPVESKVLEARAAGANPRISETTLKRARAELGIKPAHDGVTGVWWTGLPGKGASPPPSCGSGRLGPLGPLGVKQEDQEDQGGQENTLYGSGPLAGEGVL